MAEKPVWEKTNKSGFGHARMEGSSANRMAKLVTRLISKSAIMSLRGDENCLDCLRNTILESLGL